MSTATSTTRRRILTAVLALALVAAAAVGITGTAHAVPTVTATFPVGVDPIGAVVSPDGSSVYVINEGSGTVSVISTSTDQVRATIPVGNEPSSLAVSPDGSEAWVVNTADSTISIIDTSHDVVTTTIAVPTGPDSVAFAPDGSSAWVAALTSSVSRIDTATHAITTVSVPIFPTSVRVTPDGTKALAPAYGFLGATDFYVIDTVTLAVETVEVPLIMRVAVAPDSSRAFLLSSSFGLLVLDLATLDISQVTVGGSPNDVAISPNGAKVLVSNGKSDSISVIDPATLDVLGQIKSVGGPYRLAFSPDGAKAYVTLDDSDSLGVIEPGATSVDAVAVGDGPHAIGVVGTKVYVVNQYSNSVSVVTDQPTPPAPPDPVPGAPVSVAGQAGDQQVMVSWAAPTYTGTSDITSYTVSGSAVGQSGVAGSCTTAGLSCVVSGLTNGTAYTFTVTAANAAGSGPPSTPSAAVTPQSAPLMVQTPVGCGQLPARIKKRGVSRLQAVACRTDAGQRVRLQVRATPGRHAKSVLFRMVKKRHGRIRIRTFGHHMKITVTQTAPAATGYLAYKNTKTYRV